MTAGRRFSRSERRVYAARAKEARAKFASLPHYGTGANGRLEPITDPEARDFIAGMGLDCIAAGGTIQFRLVPEKIAMAFPGARQRRVAGTDRCWLAVGFDEDGRLTSCDIWVGAPEGASIEAERAGVIGRLEANMAELLKPGWPPRPPRPRLAFNNG